MKLKHIYLRDKITAKKVKIPQEWQFLFLDRRSGIATRCDWLINFAPLS